MSNVIQFLEAMGSRPLSAADYAATVAALEVENPERQALLGRDHQALADLLGGRPKMYFMIATPQEDVPDEEVPADPDSPDGDVLPVKGN